MFIVHLCRFQQQNIQVYTCQFKEKMNFTTHCSKIKTYSSTSFFSCILYNKTCKYQGRYLYACSFLCSLSLFVLPCLFVSLCPCKIPQVYSTNKINFPPFQLGMSRRLPSFKNYVLGPQILKPEYHQPNLWCHFLPKIVRMRTTCILYCFPQNIPTFPSSPSSFL